MAQIGLLEDNVRIAKLLSTFLQFAGHDVTIYEYAKKCLQALQSYEMSVDMGSASVDRAAYPYLLPIEVLVLDLSLPDIDGVEVVWRLQSHPLTQRLPLILCTGATASEVARALRIAPSAGCVMKPFKLETLVSAVSAALNLVPQ
jgi:CheY-like chemotaxis protein